MRLAVLAGMVAACLGAPATASAVPLIAEYGDTTIQSDAHPTDVVVGPDGNQWYTLPGRDAIARVTPSAEVEEITAGISSGAEPRSITVGPDGNIWFTEPGVDRIAIRKSVGFEVMSRRRAGAVSSQDRSDADLQGVVDGLVEDVFVGAGLTGARQAFHVPGAVLTVDAPGRPPRTFAAGAGDLGRRLSITGGRAQPVGSGTKPMTAVLVLRLVERGQIGIDEPLLQAAARNRRDGGRLARLTRRHRGQLAGVTVRRLLNMTSGLQDYFNTAAFARAFAAAPRASHSMSQLAAWGLAAKRLFTPGARGRTYYSNTNYVLLGMLVEAVAGRSYPSQLRALFRRAGMRASSYPTGLLSRDLVHGYGPPLPSGALPAPLPSLRTAFADAPRITLDRDAASVWIVSSAPRVRGPTVPLSPAGPAELARYGGAAPTTWQDVTRGYDLAGVGSAAGGAVSTTGDLARFWTALFRGRLLQPRTVRLLRQSVAAPPNPAGVRNYYGLGVQRQDIEPGAFWPGSPRLRLWMKLGDVFGYTSASYYVEGPPRYDGLVVTNTTNLFPSPVGDLGALRDTLRAISR